MLDGAWTSCGGWFLVDAVEALAIMRRTGNSRLMVAEDGRLVGLVTLKDLLRLIAFKMDLEDMG